MTQARLFMRVGTLLPLLLALASCGDGLSREERVNRAMLQYGSQAVNLDKAMKRCREKSRSGCATAQRWVKAITATNREICDLDGTKSMCPFDASGWEDRSSEVDQFAAAATLR